jgi:hypothetical protein
MPLMTETAQIENVEQSTQKHLWQAFYWISYPFDIHSVDLSIYGNESGASAL